jgi:hypothetical protein
VKGGGRLRNNVAGLSVGSKGAHRRGNSQGRWAAEGATTDGTYGTYETSAIWVRVDTQLAGARLAVLLAPTLITDY